MCRVLFCAVAVAAVAGYFGKDEAKAPQQVLFVEELSALVMESVPDLWRLAQAYFSGSLVQV